MQYVFCGCWLCGASVVLMDTRCCVEVAIWLWVCIGTWRSCQCVYWGSQWPGFAHSLFCKKPTENFKSIGHHARPRRAPATVPLHTGANRFRTMSETGNGSVVKNPQHVQWLAWCCPFPRRHACHLTIHNCWRVAVVGSACTCVGAFAFVCGPLRPIRCSTCSPVLFLPRRSYLCLLVFFIGPTLCTGPGRCCRYLRGSNSGVMIDLDLDLFSGLRAYGVPTLVNVRVEVFVHPL